MSFLDLLFLFAFIALIPTFLMMMTCFTRLVISFSFLITELSQVNVYSKILSRITEIREF